MAETNGLKISESCEGGLLTLSLEGRLDTCTSELLEKAIFARGESFEKLKLDMAGLYYVSSSGLRVLLKAQKELSCRGGMKLVNVRGEILDILEITGFTDILDIE